MPVLPVVAASVSPARKPVLTDTLAEARVGLPTSDTVRAGDAVTAAPPCVKVTVLPAPPSTGAGISVTPTVLVTVLELKVPSFTIQLKVRLVSVPEFVGPALVEL